jgi:nucleotide-binding universal stress UspA family protein
MFKRVLLCHDGSDTGRRALKRGAELAILLNARVFLLLIESESQWSAATAAGVVGQACVAEQELDSQKSLEESIQKLTARGVVAKGYFARGNTIDTIAEYAGRLSADLIVVGHYPKSTGGRWWSGPERAALAERVNCCVLIAVDETTPCQAQPSS